METKELKSILILDDDPDYRRLLLTFLKKYFPDCEIHEYDPVASGAPDENFDWQQYDLLLLDYFLSVDNITGLDILQKNKENPDFPTTIMLTAAEDEELAFRALKFGISEFIRKQELTKTRLHTSIVSAWAKQKDNKKRQEKLEKIQRAFSKKIFYKTLQQNVESIEGVKNRILIGFRIAGHNENNEPIHSFVKDRIIRHIAKNSYSFFQNLNLEPNITLFSEKMAVILLDIQQDINNVIELIKNLHQVHLDEPFIHENSNIAYKLETGILHLTSGTINQEELTEYFQVACDKASEAELDGNKIHIMDADRKNVVEQEKASIKTSIEAENLLYIKSFDVQFDQSKLDDKSRKIIEALNEKRLVQTFQPVILLAGNEGDDFFDRDIYRVSSQLVQSDGDAIPANELFSDIDNVEMNKYYDRWLLKETIGTIMGLNKQAAASYYILNLGHESIADTTLFNWLRNLLSGFESKQPGKQLILEISNKDLIENSKQVTALMKYLHQSHNFRFALSHIEDVNAIKSALSFSELEIFMLSHTLLPNLATVQTEESMNENFTSYLKKSGKRILARDLNDAFALTQAISSGADFATGDFIGEAQTSIEDENAIESYDIERLDTIH